jgi:serine/threonine protein phosphatase PrpC
MEVEQNQNINSIINGASSVITNLRNSHLFNELSNSDVINISEQVSSTLTSLFGNGGPLSFLLNRYNNSLSNSDVVNRYNIITNSLINNIINSERNITQPTLEITSQQTDEINTLVNNTFTIINDGLFNVMDRDELSNMLEEIKPVKTSQLKRILRKMKFTNITDNIECSICLENIQKNQKCYKLNCNHFYHSNKNECLGQTNLLTWLSKSNTCPICRSTVY